MYPRCAPWSIATRRDAGFGLVRPRNTMALDTAVAHVLDL